MIRGLRFFLLPLLAAPLAAQQAAPLPPARWHDVRELTIEGQGWKETRHPFDRLPAKAEGVVRPPVWSLSQDSAGMSVRFITDAPWVRARWKVRKERLAMPHMPATGVSGLDLYVRDKRGWRWLANGRPEESPANDRMLVRGITAERREYQLYFPLYNGIDALEIGLPPDAVFERAPVSPRKPVVFYGTSILQGGCASRPGMAYPALISRRLEWPHINLGFSGNGRSEPEMAALLAELDPAAYVLDSLPNLSAKEAAERVEPFIRTLRQAHPRTPIVLVENVVYTDSDFVETRRRRWSEANAVLRGIYQKLRKAGDRNLHYVPAGELLGDDAEGTVDGTHPTDLGFLRMSQVIGKTLASVLAAQR